MEDFKQCVELIQQFNILVNSRNKSRVRVWFYTKDYSQNAVNCMIVVNRLRGYKKACEFKTVIDLDDYEHLVHVIDFHK